MKNIRDPIHGNIKFTDVEISILDTLEMQRLRHIKQLGFVSLVYPSATHTRFEHSMGVFHLASMLANKLKLEKEETGKLKAASLLHDVGHGPFSHSSESAIRTHVKLEHETNTKKLIEDSSVADAIKKAGYDPKEIAKIAVGKKPPLSSVLVGDIDVDRMDYLVRDSYYTGAAYGVVDLDRILDTMKKVGGKILLHESGLASAESLVRARYLMYPTVYLHHTVRIIDAMFSAAVLSCLENEIFTVSDLHSIDDIGLISSMRKLDTFPGELIRRIDQRRLYKRAVVLDAEDLGKNFKRLTKLKNAKLKALEIELRESCGLPEGDVLLDIPQPLFTEEANAQILFKGEVRSLKDVSPLTKSMMKGQWNYWNVGVYCAKKNLKRVEKPARELLLGVVG